MVSNISNINIQKANLANLNSNPQDSNISMSVIPQHIQEGDSTHFTSKQKSKDQTFVQKHWGKMLLGAASITVGAILTKGKLWAKEKPVSFEKVQQNLAEIFDKKNITKEETENFIQKYKEFYKIRDKKEFITKSFEQMKKDFGYENIPCELKITEKLEKNHDGSFTFGHNILNKISVYKGFSKNEALNTLCHEFTHLRQREYMIRTSSEKLTEAMAKGSFNNLEYNPEIKKIYEKNPDEFKALILAENQKIVDKLNQIFGKLPKFEKNSPQYIQGEKYIEAKAQKIAVVEKSKMSAIEIDKLYHDNLLEQEAWHNGSLMQEIAKYIQYQK